VLLDQFALKRRTVASAGIAYPITPQLSIGPGGERLWQRTGVISTDPQSFEDVLRGLTGIDVASEQILVVTAEVEIIR
jgi:hypothetical protein